MRVCCQLRFETRQNSRGFFGGNHSRTRGRENPETQTEAEFALHFKRETPVSPSLEGT